MRKKGTAKVYNAIKGTDLTDKNGKYHIASHCGSVQYDSDTSVTIGWGLHGVTIISLAFVPDQARKKSGCKLSGYCTETGMPPGIY